MMLTASEHTDPAQADVTAIIRLADSPLILAHRLSEWCGRAPELELDIALVNLSLDLLGQARMLYAYAVKLNPEARDEDALVFLRDELDWRNMILCEQPNGNFADTIVRQALFDSYNLIMQDWMAQQCRDTQLRAIAAKARIETRYHQRFSHGWVLRLAGGTEVSAVKTQAALDSLWRFTDELCRHDDSDQIHHAHGIIPPSEHIKTRWLEIIEALIAKAGLRRPDDTHQIAGAREGHHSEHLGYLLAEMQHLPRCYPDATW